MESQSTCSSAARHARASPPAESAAESPTRGEDSRLSLLDWALGRMPAGSSSRTSLAYCPPRPVVISPDSFRNSPAGRSKCRATAGGTPESSRTRPEDSGFAGECLTLDMPEHPHFQGACRSEGVASSLSDIVETGPVPQRYCLAASYAEALLRRAERLGYRLPKALENVLRASASR